MSAYDWSAIRAAYEGGASLDVIFERFGADVSHASRKLRAMGVTMRRRGAPRRADYATLAAEYATATTPADVARRYGVSLRTVHRAAEVERVRRRQ